MLENMTKDEIRNLSDLFNSSVIAYRNGRSAAESMLTLQDCPYDDGIEREAWMRGYSAVREEDYNAAQKQAIRATYGTAYEVIK